MFVSDLIIAIIATIVASAALFLNEDKINEWQKEQMKVTRR